MSTDTSTDTIETDTTIKPRIDDATQAKLDNWFSYHPPEGDQAERYTVIRAQAQVFAETVARLCPDSADRTVALRHIRDAVFNANASIACGGK